jgi:pyruvate dehydrogenase E2 component (dihydrolipoamide acetyltransferase)/4,5:9,10-diseco-3-hydroxy-5,9,17-trioxoandrosta-1(10),2-diene-4-oate hydrolase
MTLLSLTTSISAGGFRLNFLESGPPDGPPVLLVHGGGTWLYSFRHLFAPLAALGCRVLALDMPGHGYTQPLPGVRPAYDLDSMAGTLAAFLDARAVTAPVRLIGNSWGGGWALRFAQLHPERVSSLALLAPSGFCGKEVWLYESLKYPLLGELTALLANRAVARWFYRRAFHDPAMVSEEMVGAAFAPMAACRENRRAQYKLMRRLDWCLTEAAMERTATPALLIWGREDRLWPVSMAARFSRSLPSCCVEIFEGCGHLPHEEMPERTLDRLRAFWGNQA